VFTGIIEEMGTVLSIKKGSQAHVLQIKGQVVLEDLKTGDSVAVNGAVSPFPVWAGMPLPPTL